MTILILYWFRKVFGCQGYDKIDCILVLCDFWGAGCMKFKKIFIRIKFRTIVTSKENHRNRTKT